MTPPLHPEPVPGYLGRILDATGRAVGTCFQVEPGVLVTACHVLADIGRAAVRARVAVDALGGGDAVPAEVRATDPLRDMAVLATQTPLPASVTGLVATASVTPSASIVISGVSRFPDRREHRYLTTTGVWQGAALREDRVALSRVESSGVVRGMSGAPVRLIPGDSVVGVVSARYNSADGWLRDSIWIARTEDLLPLLGGLLTIDLAGRHLGSATELDRAHLTRLVGIHENNLRLLETQVAGYGPQDVPLHKLNQLDHERAELARLRSRLDQSS
ncbi:MAG: hypothetical protein AUI10_12550 [Actinobacteria bacterium 13_2_20CM_2_72_6]|nr:MAG: hypothetical protein AUI10_12550 [Actinobacteria bacterium 13_2_20CM_2_72_6]